MGRMKPTLLRAGMEGLVSAALIVGITGLASCGGSTATERPDVLATDFPTAAAEAACANAADCCRMHDRKPDGDRCRRIIAANFNLFDWSRVQGPIPGSAKCLEALAAWTQSCTSAFFTPFAVGCAEALVSVEAQRKAHGQPCDKTCSLGCTADNPPQLSQGCFIEDGLYCDKSSHTCQTRSAPGSACNHPFGCTSDACVEGTCVPLGAEGASCSFAVGCEPGLYCALPSGRQCSSTEPEELCHCTAKIPEGEDCTIGVCASGQCNYGKCKSTFPIGLEDLNMVCR